jgi:septal ring factor EnvC (AmiA/AmiB activator)
MAEEENGSTPNVKAFGGVLAILAVIAGVYATIQPMIQRIDNLQGQISEFRQDIKEHSASPHYSIAQGLSKIPPMSQRLDFLQTRIKEIVVLIQRHEDNEGHIGMLQSSSSMRERFKEVETQFVGLRREFNHRLEQLEKNVENYEEKIDYHNNSLTGLNASQWERIKNLEREVFKENKK